MARKPIRILFAFLFAAPGVKPAAPVAAELEHAETVRLGFGWRDNVMLSAFAPLARGFARTELESFLLWRRGDWRAIGLLNADVLRYFSPPAEASGEQQWLAHAESRWEPRDEWRVALKADAFLQDMVVDLSETEAARTVLADRVRGGIATFAPRMPIPGGFTLEPSWQLKRVDYRKLTGDYDETRAGARLQWHRGQGPVLSLGWGENRRSYADRPNYTIRGRPLAGTRLEFRLREVQLRAETSWRAVGDWNAALAFTRASTRDGASGFFDLDQKGARLELSWRTGPWRLTLEGDAKRADYRVQTVGTGLAPSPRLADTFSARLRAERRINPRWLGFVEQAWERNRSNEREFSYRANTALAGVQRDF